MLCCKLSMTTHASSRRVHERRLLRRVGCLARCGAPCPRGRSTASSAANTWYGTRPHHLIDGPAGRLLLRDLSIGHHLLRPNGDVEPGPSLRPGLVEHDRRVREAEALALSPWARSIASRGPGRANRGPEADVLKPPAQSPVSRVRHRAGAASMAWRWPRQFDYALPAVGDRKRLRLEAHGLALGVHRARAVDVQRDRLAW